MKTAPTLEKPPCVLSSTDWVETMAGVSCTVAPASTIWTVSLLVPSLVAIPISVAPGVTTQSRPPTRTFGSVEARANRPQRSFWSIAARAVATSSGGGGGGGGRGGGAAVAAGAAAAAPAATRSAHASKKAEPLRRPAAARRLPVRRPGVRRERVHRPGRQPDRGADDPLPRLPAARPRPARAGVRPADRRPAAHPSGQQSGRGLAVQVRVRPNARRILVQSHDIERGRGHP